MAWIKEGIELVPKIIGGIKLIKSLFGNENEDKNYYFFLTIYEILYIWNSKNYF